MANTAAHCGETGLPSRRVDRVVAALADERRRRVLGYLRAAEGEVASVETLADYASEPGGPTRERLELTLQHATLPKLADLGVLEYDPESRMVRYRGAPAVERAFTVLAGADR